MDHSRMIRQLEFLREIDKLKHILRRTLLMDSSRLENDSEHTWHMAVCALLFLEYSDVKELNILKVLKMVLLHDVVEIDAGDTFAYDEKGHLDKEEREILAADRIFGLLPKDQAQEFRSLWDEFEEFESDESKYAHSIDTFMPMYHNYITKGQTWEKHNVTYAQVIKRNKPMIEPGSKQLWDFVKSLLDDAVEKGYLKK